MDVKQTGGLITTSTINSRGVKIKKQKNKNAEHLHYLLNVGILVTGDIDHHGLVASDLKGQE